MLSPCLGRRLCPQSPHSGFRFHLDFLLRIVLLGFWNSELQNPVGHRGLNGRGVDASGQLDGSQKGPINALAHANIAVTFLVLVFLLATDGQKVVLERNLDVIRLEPWQLGGNLDAVVFLIDVNPWYEIGQAGRGGEKAESA